MARVVAATRMGGGDSEGCTTKYGKIEVSYDGGETWETWWEGWYTECEE